jgi:hypothetical protein
MAAILRLAGGLDRSRSQQVRDVIVKVDDGSALLQVTADQEPQVDIWGAERRTDLFEKVFGMPLAIRWSGAVEPAVAEGVEGRSGDADPPQPPARRKRVARNAKTGEDAPS